VGDLGAAARWYARHGWRVLPVRNRDKVPALPEWQRAASTDEATVARWWVDRPACNVGVATGPESGLWALDIDPRHGGHETLAEWQREHGRLPDTVVSLTGGGGEQYLFRWPEGRDIRSRAGIGLGIDVRGRGGQIVVAPSVHPSGREYRWEESSRPDEVALAEAPGWLLDLVDPPRAQAPPPASRAPLGGAVDPQLVAGALEHLSPEPYDQWILVGQILHDAPGVDGWALWSTWSARSAKWDAEQGAGKWASFGRSSGAATVGTIFALAKEAGWQRPRRPVADERSSGATPLDPVGAPGSEPPQPEQNDLGNAQRLLAARRGQALYCHTWGYWLWWCGTHWERDTTAQIDRWSVAAIDAALRVEVDQARALADSAEHERVARRLERRAERLDSFRLKSLNDRGISCALRRAQTLAEFSAEAADFDRDQWLFAVGNGTLDLRTGALLPHDPAHRITRCSPVEYSPGARDERWERFLDQATGGDDDLRAYLARAAGYSMTGSTREQAVFMVTGPGGSGKGTFTTAMLSILGSYGDVVPFDIFLSGNQQRKWTLAKIAAARLISCEESSAGRVMADDVMKLLTGGSKIEAEAKYAAPFSYLPHFKCWLTTNHLPRTSDTDDAVWRRVRVLRFDHKPSVVDKDLPEYLATSPAARAAVLAWMVAGAVDYCRQGLAEPAVVLGAVQAYRDDMNPVLPFIQECCVVAESATVSRPDLRRAYDAWCLRNGAKPLHFKAFTERMRAAGGSDCRTTQRLPNGRTRGVDGWAGLRLRTDEDPEEVPMPVAPTPLSGEAEIERSSERSTSGCQDKSSVEAELSRTRIYGTQFPIFEERGRDPLRYSATPLTQPMDLARRHARDAGAAAAQAGEPCLPPVPPAHLPENAHDEWRAAWLDGFMDGCGP